MTYLIIAYVIIMSYINYRTLKLYRREQEKNEKLIDLINEGVYNKHSGFQKVKRKINSGALGRHKTKD